MSKKTNPLFGPVEDGVYINGKYFGPANGFYRDGMPAVLNGCYEGGMFKNGIYIDGHWIENATGLYLNNIRQPFSDGIYINGQLQTDQFQQVLEIVRTIHAPEHWASWKLDGSFEEDNGQFPIGDVAQANFAPMGRRQVVQFGGSGSRLSYGNTSDFKWMHESRVFTAGAWFVTPDQRSARLISTNENRATVENGFSFYNNAGRIYLDMPSATATNRQTSNVLLGFTPKFYTIVSHGTGADMYINGIYSNTVAYAGGARAGDSYTPLTFGFDCTCTLWNVFLTDAQLDQDEVYSLYQAGLNDIQAF